MVDVEAESMVGGTIFGRRSPPQVIQREISRVLVLNLSGKRNGATNTDRILLSLTPPPLLSRGTHCVADASGMKRPGPPVRMRRLFAQTFFLLFVVIRFAFWL
jgi:hypothetical protein